MKENIEEIQNKKYFKDINEAIKVYKEFRRYKNDGFIDSIDPDFFFNLTDEILSDYKKVLKKNEELKEKWDKDTHKLQNDLDIANAKKIELQKENEKLERANKCYINSIHSIVPVLNQDYIEKQKVKDITKGLIKNNTEDNESVKRFEEMRRNLAPNNDFYKKSYQTSIHKLNAQIEARKHIINILQDLLESEG